MGKGKRGGGEAAQARLKGAAPAAPPSLPRAARSAPRRAAWAPPARPLRRGVRGAAPGPGSRRVRRAAAGRGPAGSGFISLVISGKLLYSGNAVPLIEQAR